MFGGKQPDYGHEAVDNIRAVREGGTPATGTQRGHILLRHRRCEISPERLQ